MLYHFVGPMLAPTFVGWDNNDIFLDYLQLLATLLPDWRHDQIGRLSLRMIKPRDVPTKQ